MKDSMVKFTVSLLANRYPLILLDWFDNGDASSEAASVDLEPPQGSEHMNVDQGNIVPTNLM